MLRLAEFCNELIVTCPPIRWEVVTDKSKAILLPLFTVEVHALSGRGLAGFLVETHLDPLKVGPVVYPREDCRLLVRSHISKPLPQQESVLVQQAGFVRVRKAIGVEQSLWDEISCP